MAFVSFNEIGRLDITLPGGAGLTPGTVCKVTAAGVAACSAGDQFCGVVQVIEEAHSGVQVAGFVTTAYSGATAPTVGYLGLSADGSGGVKVDTAANKYLAVQVDTVAKTVTFML